MKKNLKLVIAIGASIFISIFKLANARTTEASFPQIFPLSSLNGENGFAINGTSAGSAGFAIQGAGDINGDGRGDMLIFAMDGNEQNKAYVLFGRDEAWPASISLDILDGSSGFIINASNDGLEPLVACGVGDINHDGIDDLLIGDAGVNVSSGQSYIVFGSRDSWPAEFNLSDLDGTNGFAINGINPYEFSGSFVSALGDVNGDGIADFMIGTGVRGVKNRTNQVYIVFGNIGPWAASMNLADLDGTNGVIINGINQDVGSYSISGIEDINGDDLKDIIIGNPSANNYTGQSYVIFGMKGTWPNQFSLGDLDGTNGFIINGIQSNDYSGFAVSGVGDVNRDGLADMLISAQWANKYGQIYVLFGNQDPWPGQFNLTNLSVQTGFFINGIPGSGGYTIGGAGDVNRDGYDDIVIGTTWANNFIGQSYVVFGSKVPKLFVNLTNLSATEGFVLEGINVGDWCGDSVGPTGDFNHDGIDDFTIGASQANNVAGQGYVIYGQAGSWKNRNAKK